MTTATGAFEMRADQKLDDMSQWIADIWPPRHDVAFLVGDLVAVCPMDDRKRRLHDLACQDRVFQWMRPFQKSEDWRCQQTYGACFGDVSSVIALNRCDASRDLGDEEPLLAWQSANSCRC